MRIGFIGAGRMGLPMVVRLSDGGNDVAVLVRSARSRPRIDALACADAANSVADVARDADAVVVCVHTDDQVREICGEGGLLGLMSPGSVLIVHTTGSPFLVRELQEIASATGVSVVDAPVSGGPHDIAAGTVTVFLGGYADAVEKAVRVLSFYAGPIHRVGGLGSGQLMKLVNNAIFLANVEVVSAAMDFGAKLGLERAAMLECVQQGSGNSTALAGVAAVGSVEAFRQSVAEFLIKDMSVVRDVAAATDIDLGAIGPLLGPADSFVPSIPLTN